jgi:EAL domain-containing protein (putative c-di-GMP-specific phosphodiesterase class I)
MRVFAEKVVMPRRAPAIERDAAILRTRRTASVVRAMLCALAIILLITRPGLVPVPALGIAGFAIILLSSVVLLAQVDGRWARIEEASAASAAFLILGCGKEQVTVISMLWLVALAVGVMARGGRVGNIGRPVVLVALLLPIVRLGELHLEYAAFALAVVGMQLTAGRLTMELNRLLRAARLDAENAETLLLAGDIAARVASREKRLPASRPAAPEPTAALTPAEEAGARLALATLLRGEGMGMAVQPIVDLRDGSVHAYEALARFQRRRSDRNPLNWFALAEELGERVALERACLGTALELFPARPDGVRLAVNLSVAALRDPATVDLLQKVSEVEPNALGGLIVEITEETLVEEESGFGESLAALRGCGAQLAVDDVGAGYSGLRQITAVGPDYLKLDHSLVREIDRDDERAALVAALTGYADKVGALLVAEGIEELAELECLLEIGVPLAQGFYLGAPDRPWPTLSKKGAASLGAGDVRALAATRERALTLTPV